MMAENKIEDILKQRAKLLKAPLQKEVDTGEVINVIEFKIGNGSYSFNSLYVNEVLPLAELTEIPCTPNFIKGVINVHGKILAVIDINVLLNLNEAENTNGKNVIIVSHNQTELGIVCDKIVGSKELNVNQLQSKITTITDAQSSFILGITNERNIVIDIKTLLESEELIINEKI